MTDSPPIYEHGPLRLRRCRHGVMLYNINDNMVGAMLDLYGEFSEEEDELFHQMLRPGMTVIEAGANIGAHTVPIAQIVGTHGRVLAFEPQRSMFQILCANLAMNGLEQVEPYWAGVGGEDGVISVARLDSSVNQNFGSLSLGGPGESVRLVKLDSLNLSTCDLIKIDVEGMELDVILGAEETIRRHAPIIYAENDRADKSPALIEKLQTLGYRCYWHLPPYVRVPNFRDNTENKFARMVSANMLCVSASRKIIVKGMREVTGPGDSWLPPSR